MLNNFFHSVFITENVSILPTAYNMLRGSDNEKLRRDALSEDDITKYLRNIDTSKNTFVDRISNKILCEGQAELLLPLKLLFSRTLQEAIVLNL